MSDLENQKPKEQKLEIHETNSAHDGISSYNPLEHGSEVQRVVSDGDFIHFGNEKYRRSELAEAFGGTLNPGLAPPPRYNLANPAPLGLCAFALTTFLLSLCNCEARGVKIPNIVVGAAFFYGGMAQFVAGMFEIAAGNTFGGAALSSYAGFWGSWAAVQVDSFGIASAYTDKTEFRYAMGLFLIGWFIFTFFLMLLTLKSTVAFFLLFFFLALTFLVLGISEIQNSVSVKKAGGVLGLITAFISWYNAYAGLANKQNSYITVKAIPLPKFNAHQTA